eukprot:TRINITY_DN48769_c0_g1_i1.p1 TRINITY_DN48769_c0_g1~~TRINITY_DN48769_c0_g1_i1.p1  ORF type:complete len:671 (-),score=137.21 TRINITY_DN48769_c0_g1_i1:129-2042(-)
MAIADGVPQRMINSLRKAGAIPGGSRSQHEEYEMPKFMAMRERLALADYGAEERCPGQLALPAPSSNSGTDRLSAKCEPMSDSEEDTFAALLGRKRGAPREMLRKVKTEPGTFTRGRETQAWLPENFDDDRMGSPERLQFDPEAKPGSAYAARSAYRKSYSRQLLILRDEKPVLDFSGYKGGGKSSSLNQRFGVRKDAASGRCYAGLALPAVRGGRNCMIEIERARIALRLQKGNVKLEDSQTSKEDRSGLLADPWGCVMAADDKSAADSAGSAPMEEAESGLNTDRGAFWSTPRAPPPKSMPFSAGKGGSSSPMAEASLSARPPPVPRGSAAMGADDLKPAVPVKAAPRQPQVPAKVPVKASPQRPPVPAKAMPGNPPQMSPPASAPPTDDSSRQVPISSRPVFGGSPDSKIAEERSAPPDSNDVNNDSSCTSNPENGKAAEQEVDPAQQEEGEPNAEPVLPNFRAESEPEGPPPGLEDDRLNEVQMALVKELAGGAKYHDPAREPNASSIQAKNCSLIDVKELKFCHKDIGPKFTHGHHKNRPVVTLLQDLHAGKVVADQLPPLVVMRSKKGLQVVCGNRRLYCLKRYSHEASKSVNVWCVVHDLKSKNTPRELLFKYVLATTTEDSNSIVSRAV